MQAVKLADGHYQFRDIAKPVPKDHELLIKVAYAGINRADLLQLKGRYPLPEHGVPGMEISGKVVACGSKAKGFAVGDNVCALLSDGAFAEYICVPATQTLPVPEGMGLDEAAALPEACFTVWISLVWQARLQKSETVLIHGGAGGIGSMAIQMAKRLGATVFATAGSEEKCAACTKLGAYAINYKNEDFVEVIKAKTDNKGVDVILDSVGGDYLPRNLTSLAQDGRLCVIAFQKGSRVEVNLSPVLLKHLTIIGSTLRARPETQKAAIAAELREHIWPFMGGKSGIKPLIGRVFPFEEAEKALAIMHEGLNLGKILLKIAALPA